MYLSSHKILHVRSYKRQLSVCVLVMDEPVETIRPRGKRNKKRRKEKINLVFDANKRK